MADTGWVVCTAAEDVASGADEPWTSLANLTAEDNVYATVSLVPTQTPRRIQGHTFGLAALIPVGATIDGIEVRFSAKTSVGSHTISDVLLIDPDTGNPVGDDKGSGSINAVEAFYTFGGAADKWNWLDVDRTQLIANGFKVGVKFDVATDFVTLSADSIQVRVYYTSGGGATTIDMWQPRIADVMRPRRPMIPAQLSIIDPGSAAPAPALSWFAQTSEPVRTVPQPQRVPGVLGIHPGTFPPPETITIDKWFQPASEPVRTVPQPPRTPGAFQWEPSTFAFVEDIYPDKWFSMNVQLLPLREARAQPTVLAEQIDPSGLVVPQLPQMRPQDPVRRIPRAQPTTGAFTFERGQLPPILVSWYQPTSIPVLAEPRQPATAGAYPFVPLEVIAPLEWLQQPQVPQRLKIATIAPNVAYAIQPSQVANVELEWLVLPCEPIRMPCRAQPTSGQMHLEQSLLVTPPLGWLTEPPERPQVARRAQPTVGLLSSHEQYQPSTFDVCVQMQPPVRLVPRAQATTGEQHVDPSLFVTPDVTSWYRPLSVPVIKPRLPVAAMPFTSFTVWIIGDAVLDVGLEWTAYYELLEFSRHFRIRSKTPGAITDGVASFVGVLESGELLSGAPAVQVSPNDGFLTVDRVALGGGNTAITFRVTGGRDGTEYVLKCRCGTDSGQTLELPCIIRVS